MRTDLDHSGRSSWSVHFSALFQALMDQCTPRFPHTLLNQTFPLCSGSGAMGPSIAVGDWLGSSNTPSNNINNGELS